MRQTQHKTMKLYGSLKNITAFFMVLFILFGTTTVYAEHSDYTNKDIQQAIEKIYKWKKENINGKGAENLFTTKFSNNAGTTACDWYAISIGRTGINDDYFSYLTILKNNIEDIYNSDEKLKQLKPTDLHRMSLTALSLGENPQQFGKDKNGKAINLVADGTYNKSLDELGKQGINSYIWALILLNSTECTIPKNSEVNKDSLVDEILKRQLENGSFSFDDSASIDITAMAIQSLALYKGKHSEKAEISIKKAVEWLSTQQSKDGDFVSYGEGCSESTAQVIVALCSANIDPVNDDRFIKKGSTALDGLMKYQLSNGSFTHTKSSNAENSTSSEQAFYALCSLYRYNNKLDKLFSFDNSKGIINIFTNKAETSGLTFNKNDMEEYQQLSKNVTTREYNSVLRLYEKAKVSDNSAELKDIIQNLEKKKADIENIQSEIDSINEKIADNLYPIESISKDKLDIVDEVISKSSNLSEYDQSKITNLDNIRMVQAELKSSNRSIIIAIVVVALIITALTIVIIRVINKKKNSECVNDEW